MGNIKQFLMISADFRQIFWQIRGDYWRFLTEFLAGGTNLLRQFLGSLWDKRDGLGKQKDKNRIVYM